MAASIYFKFLFTLSDSRPARSCLRSQQYIGEFLDGVRHGMGRFEYSNGNLFTGAWERDMKCGFGTLKWANGDEYTGEWKENKM